MRAKVAHLELWTGIAGDMWVGACLDAGWPEARLQEIPSRLGLDGVRIEVEQRAHRGLAGLGIRVETGESHPHRGLPEIAAILTGGVLEGVVVERALQVFRRLAEAEARVHGVSVDRVHFHEVGALDAIVDIVGAVRALEDLGVKSLTADPVPLSRGEISAAHGLLAVPPPAVAVLLEGWPVVPAEGEGEWTTPTGAALLTTLARPSTAIPAMRVSKVGLGAGSRTHPLRANLARLWLGEALAVSMAPGGEAPEGRMGPEGSGGPGEEAGARAEESVELRVVSILETQVDDMSGEELAHLAERLREAGALDVYLAPVVMKKGRPGTRVCAVVRPPDGERIAEQLFRFSPTLGVRRREELRYERARGVHEVSTPWGPVRVKRIGSSADPESDVEFDDLAALCRRRGVSLERARVDLFAWLRRNEPLS